MPPTGTFECSDPLITQLHKNVEWSMKSNFLDMPDRLPPAGARRVDRRCADLYPVGTLSLMDTRAFFRKWLKDLSLEQFPEGRWAISCPIPTD